MYISSVSTRILLTTLNFAHLGYPLPSAGLLQVTSLTPSVTSLPPTFYHSTTQSAFLTAAILSLKLCNSPSRNTSTTPNNAMPSPPEPPSSSTSPTNSIVFPVKNSSTLSPHPSPNSYLSPHFSTKMQPPSTTNGMMARGAPSS